MNRKIWKLSGLLLPLAGCVLILSAGSVAASDKAEWEISTSMEMPGMPFAIPPTVTRQCIEDQAVPYQKKSDDEKCEVVSKKIIGNTMTWKVVCNDDEGRTEMNGVSTYTGDTMDSQVKMSGGDGEFSMHMTGKKLGPCQ